MRKLVLSGLTALAAVGSSVVVASPAQAVGTIVICNSADSVGRAFQESDEFIYRVDTSKPRTRVFRAECVRFDDTSTLRIGFSYYSSYRIKPAGGSYGPCHNANTDTRSNPGSGSKYYYKGYAFSECTNNGPN